MNNTNNPQFNSQNKDKQFLNQFKVTFESFYKEPQSMKELSVKTGIDRASICWYCRAMRKTGVIAINKKAPCCITKRIVNKYTTNPDYFPISSQLKLF